MKSNFEINPLDINIAKMQFNLINKLKNSSEISDIIEVFENKDPRLNLSKIKIICTKDFSLKADFTFKDNSVQNLDLFSGTKSDLLNYLAEKSFFDACKQTAIQS